MSTRTVLHIGPPKTGSTYLQGILWNNRAALAGQGLLYPATHDNEHFLAAYDVQGGAFVHGDLPEADGTWSRLVARVREQPGRSVVSHEILAPSRPEHVERILGSLRPGPVDVVVMARCLDDDDDDDDGADPNDALDAVNGDLPICCRARSASAATAAAGTRCPTRRCCQWRSVKSGKSTLRVRFTG